MGKEYTKVVPATLKMTHWNLKRFGFPFNFFSVLTVLAFVVLPATQELGILFPIFFLAPILLATIVASAVQFFQKQKIIFSWGVLIFPTLTWLGCLLLWKGKNKSLSNPFAELILIALISGIFSGILHAFHPKWISLPQWKWLVTFVVMLVAALIYHITPFLPE